MYRDSRSNVVLYNGAEGGIAHPDTLGSINNANRLALSFWNEVKNLRVGRKPHTTRFFVIPIRGKGESGLLQNMKRELFSGEFSRKVITLQAIL